MGTGVGGGFFFCFPRRWGTDNDEDDNDDNEQCIAPKLTPFFYSLLPFNHSYLIISYHRKEGRKDMLQVVEAVDDDCGCGVSSRHM